MKNISSFALAFVLSQTALAEPKEIQTIDMMKVPVCSDVQKRVDIALTDEIIIGRLSQYITNIREVSYKDDILRLFKLASQTNYVECIIKPQDFPKIPSRHFLLITSMAWGVGNDSFYRAIIDEKTGPSIEITGPSIEITSPKK